MTIDQKTEGGKTILKVSGRLDTMTAPELEIRGVRDGSANAGELKIELTASDPFLRKDSFLVSLVPSSGGTLPRSLRTDRDGQTISVAYEDFPHTKEADAFYTLQAQVSDEAGNVARKTVSFSVNRCGSVYVRQDSLQKKLRTFYHREPFDVTFREMNLDEVGNARILLKKGDTLSSIARDNNITVNALKEANQLITDNLVIGQQLIIHSVS